jgi:Leucine-rich repeat (LRR) protein
LTIANNSVTSFPDRFDELPNLEYVNLDDLDLKTIPETLLRHPTLQHSSIVSLAVCMNSEKIEMTSLNVFQSSGQIVEAGFCDNGTYTRISWSTPRRSES